MVGPEWSHRLSVTSAIRRTWRTRRTNRTFEEVRRGVLGERTRTSSLKEVRRFATGFASPATFVAPWLHLCEPDIRVPHGDLAEAIQALECGLECLLLSPFPAGADAKPIGVCAPLLDGRDLHVGGDVI